MPKFEVIVSVSEIRDHIYEVEAQDEPDVYDRVWEYGTLIRDEYVDTIDSEIVEINEVED